MGIWDHFYDNSAVSEQITTHYVNLPYVSYLYDDFELVIDDQHKPIRWFDLDEVSQSGEHHKYMNQYAGRVLDYLRSKEVN